MSESATQILPSVEESVDPRVLQLWALPRAAAEAIYREAYRKNDRAALRWLALHDRYFLLTCLLRRSDARHDWIYARCRDVEADPNDHIDVWARAHYKSTIITFAGIIQEILRNPEITICIFSHIKPAAKDFLGQIKRELEDNDFLKSLFSDVLWNNPRKEAPWWSEDGGIVVRRRSNPKEATVEASGLVDGMATGKHFALRVYDDVVTEQTVTTPEMIKKITTQYELSEHLGQKEGRQWMIGTRYHFCTVGDTRILMADWTHKPIRDVQVDDKVVGWELRDGKRYLRESKVIATGVNLSQEVWSYTLENGRSVTCTPDHKWWRGPHGGGPEYAPLAITEKVRAHGAILSLRELLVPTEFDKSREAGWLAGFFDGEGTMNCNTGKNRVSGRVCLTQSMANPGLIDETRRILRHLNFDWSESWWEAEGRDRMRHDRCVFAIKGGWRERYRFLAEIAPAKKEKLAASLFAWMTTEKVGLKQAEYAGLDDVYWIETETGNYVAEGFCSKNSDTYGLLLQRNILQERRFAATRDGTFDGPPVFLSDAQWERTKANSSKSTIAAQMLLNPLAGSETTFDIQWLKRWFVRPKRINVYIMVDPSKGKHATSDNTAIAVIGVDVHQNRYLLDGWCHRMNLSRRWQLTRDVWKRWSRMPGVGSVRLGYEQFGLQTDLEFFELQMEREKLSFPIEELAWPRSGPKSKQQRIERMEPDFRMGRMMIPGVIDIDEEGNISQYDPSQKKIVREAIEAKETWRVAKPILQINEDQRRYDVLMQMLEEYVFFPFAPRDDFLDAMSRIYDLDPVAPIYYEGEPGRATSTEPPVYMDT